MTKAQRDLLEAASQAVNVEKRGNLTFADISKDPEKVSALIRAVVRWRGDQETNYWREG